MKEREISQNRQHEIEKLKEDHVKFSRSSKLFDEKEAMLNNSIKDNEVMIKKLEDEKAKLISDNEGA